MLEVKDQKEESGSIVLKMSPQLCFWLLCLNMTSLFMKQQRYEDLANDNNELLLCTIIENQSNARVPLSVREHYPLPLVFQILCHSLS